MLGSLFHIPFGTCRWFHALSPLQCGGIKGDRLGSLSRVSRGVSEISSAECSMSTENRGLDLYETVGSYAPSAAEYR